MQQFAESLNSVLDVVNGVIWHNIVLYVVLATGVLFTIWSGFSQFRALTHGTAVVRGKYDDKDDPGAINHFQALSAALSATVGLGNIAGVAVAVALGGPGAVFWMWIIGIFGMAIKTTEVTLSMLYRNTDEPDNPHGGPMWVAKHGFAKLGFGAVGKTIGGIFVITLLISAITGGNMFQAWNVGDITDTYFNVPTQVSGIILAVVVGLVIIGGIKRIGAVAGRLVPFMCVIYLLAAVIVLTINIGEIPAMLRLIVVSAVPDWLGGQATNPEGAFLGGTFAYAFLWGLKRALFSSEAGQGSAPIAHSAAKTDEPAREGVVAGLEPFIDTIVVCTLTALVILSTGAWNRDAEGEFTVTPEFVAADVLVLQNERTVTGRSIGEQDGVHRFLLASPRVGEQHYQEFPVDEVVERNTDDTLLLPSRIEPPRKTAEARRVSGEWRHNDTVFMLYRGELNRNTGRELRRVSGRVQDVGNGAMAIAWSGVRYEDGDPVEPVLEDAGVFSDHAGASLTGHAFDRAIPGLGKWLVTIACWLFAISTMISWSYYGEQGVIYLFGEKSVMPYKVIYCLLIVVATLGFIKSDIELDNLTALGTGVMLWANIPIMLIFGHQAMKAYKNYIGRLKTGELDRDSHPPAPITDVVEGKDVE